MAINSLVRRIERLEQESGQNTPVVRIVLVNSSNYIEKDTEIQRLRKDSFDVIPVCFVPAKDGKPDPDYAEYCKHLEQG